MRGGEGGDSEEQKRRGQEHRLQSRTGGGGLTLPLDVTFGA